MGRESGYQHIDLQWGPPEMLPNSLCRMSHGGKPQSQAKFICLNILFNEQVHSFSEERYRFVSSTPRWGLAGAINSTQHPSIQLNNQWGGKKSQKSIAVVSLDYWVTAGFSDPSLLAGVLSYFAVLHEESHGNFRPRQTLPEGDSQTHRGQRVFFGWADLAVTCSNEHHHGPNRPWWMVNHHNSHLCGMPSVRALYKHYYLTFNKLSGYSPLPALFLHEILERSFT